MRKSNYENKTGSENKEDKDGNVGREQRKAKTGKHWKHEESMNKEKKKRINDNKIKLSSMLCVFAALLVRLF